MDLPVNQFKRALQNGRTIFGVWLMSGAPSTAEAMGCAGFDFLVLDMEHVPVDTPQMVEILRALGNTPAPGVVRLPWNDMVMVKRALDGGAQTVMLPFVQNADEAKRAVAYTRYPPAGIRGVAGLHRASRYATVPNYLAHANTEICVIVQIETLTALAELEAIAAVPGVDSIFVGPGDLSASMGHLGQASHPDVVAAITRGMAIVRAAGKAPGTLMTDSKASRYYLEQGALFVAVGVDAMLLMHAARTLAAEFKRGVNAAAGAPAKPSSYA